MKLFKRIKLEHVLQFINTVFDLTIIGILIVIVTASEYGYGKDSISHWLHTISILLLILILYVSRILDELRNRK